MMEQAYLDHVKMMERGSKMLAEAVIEAKLGRHPGTPAHPFKLPPDWTAHVEMSKQLSEKSHFRNLGKKMPSHEIARQMMREGATVKQIAARLKKSHRQVVDMVNKIRCENEERA